MKKWIAILLLAAMTLGLGGCAAAPRALAAAAEATKAPAATPTPAPTEAPAEGGKVIVKTFTEAEDAYTDDGETLLLTFSAAGASVDIPTDPTAADAVNQTLRALYREFVDGVGGEGLSGKEAFLEGARDNLTYWRDSGMEDNAAPFQLVRTLDIARCDERVLSLTLVDETYTGGVHGYHFHHGVNFDVRTGAELTLEDLAEEPEKFLSRCTERLLAEANGPEYAMAGMFDDYADTLPTLLRDGNWYFDDQGLVVLANPYEIGPYAAGLISFTLPYRWLKWHIKPEYLPPESAADGLLEADFAETGTGTYTLDDGTFGEGPRVRLTAEGRLEDVAVHRVNGVETWNGFTFFTGSCLWYASALEDGESLDILTWIPEILPDLAVTWTDTLGTRTRYLTQSGMDGSLILMETDSFEDLPLEITHRLPFSWDIDGDGEREVINLESYEPNEWTRRWRLTVNGVPAVGEAECFPDTQGHLWISDVNWDGAAEIFFTWDPGSDDDRTIGWDGRTGQPMAFAGDIRNGRDGEEWQSTVDGRIVFSQGCPVLASYVYQLGTYAGVSLLSLDADEDEPAVMSMADWVYRGNDRELTVKKNLPVNLDSLGGAVLSPGETIRLTGSLGSTAYFVTGDGQTGSIALEYNGAAGGWLIDGVRENEYFERLPYAG